jgi:hypothetical protein
MLIHLRTSTHTSSPKAMARQSQYNLSLYRSHFHSFVVFVYLLGIELKCLTFRDWLYKFYDDVGMTCQEGRIENHLNTRLGKVLTSAW